MDWKCPLCGADDNQECSLRCSCGYELEDKPMHMTAAHRSGQLASLQPGQTAAIEKLIIPWKVSLISIVIVVFLFSVAVFSCFLPGIYAMSFYGSIFLLFLILFAFELYKSPRYIEIDFLKGTVIRHYRTMLSKQRFDSHKISYFSSVRSYFTSGKHMRNYIELVTLKNEVLVLAKLEPGSVVKSFFSFPRAVESLDSKYYREAISSNSTLRDDGFQGVMGDWGERDGITKL